MCIHDCPSDANGRLLRTLGRVALYFNFRFAANSARCLLVDMDALAALCSECSSLASVQLRSADGAVRLRCLCAMFVGMKDNVLRVQQGVENNTCSVTNRMTEWATATVREARYSITSASSKTALHDANDRQGVDKETQRGATSTEFLRETVFESLCLPGQNSGTERKTRRTPGHTSLQGLRYSDR